MTEENKINESEQNEASEAQAAPAAAEETNAKATGGEYTGGAPAEEGSAPAKRTKIKVKPNGQEENGEVKNLIFFYIAIGCFAVGVILLGLSVGLASVLKGTAGVYLLLASMIAEFCAITFLNAQKHYGENKACLIFRILSYVVLFAAVLIMGAGTIFSASNQ